MNSAFVLPGSLFPCLPKQTWIRYLQPSGEAEPGVSTSPVHVSYQITQWACRIAFFAFLTVTFPTKDYVQVYSDELWETCALDPHCVVFKNLL